MGKEMGLEGKWHNLEAGCCSPFPGCLTSKPPAICQVQDEPHRGSWLDKLANSREHSMKCPLFSSPPLLPITLVSVWCPPTCPFSKDRRNRCYSVAVQQILAALQGHLRLALRKLTKRVINSFVITFLL